MASKLKKGEGRCLKIALSVVLAVYAFSLFIPILWGVLTSFKSQEDFRLNLFGLPNPFTLENYLRAFELLYRDVENASGVVVRVYFPLMFLYSFLYAGGCALMSTTTACVVAYATVKFEKFKLSKVIYTIVVVTMILPVIGNLPSEIHMSRLLGFYNTFPGIWIMKMTFLGMYFLVFHATFRGVAKDYYEAAYLDGASEWMVMVKIALPLVTYTYLPVRPPNSITFWNDYQVPLIYLPSYPTAAYGVFLFSRSNDTRLSSVPARITGCIYMLLPVLILFIAFHKHLMGNLSMGGIKE